MTPTSVSELTVSAKAVRRHLYACARQLDAGRCRARWLAWRLARSQRVKVTTIRPGEGAAGTIAPLDAEGELRRRLGR